MSDTILKIVGPPSIVAQSDGNGGAIIKIRAHNHPVDGVRMLFDSTMLVLFLREFATRLRVSGKSIVTPTTPQLEIESKHRSVKVDPKGADMLVMIRLLAMRGVNDPPTLAFDRAAAQRLFDHIAQVTGKVI